MAAPDVAPEADLRPNPLEERVRELEHELAALKETQGEAAAYWGQLGAILDRAPLAIYLKDAQHKYLVANDELARFASRPRTEFRGKDDFAMWPREIAQIFRAQDLEVMDRRVPVEFREELALEDGMHCFITSKFPLWAADGSLFGVAGLCTEITALEQARRQLEATQADLVKQERLATLGELSAVVAHEVRNPLAVVFNALAALKRTTSAAAPDRALLDIIGEESERLDRMVVALLELARPVQARLALAQVSVLVRNAMAAARDLGKPGVEMSLQLPQSLPLAELDEGMVHQALVNLVCNATQSPERGGPVKVTVKVTVEDAPGPTLRIDVIDDGEGVLPELRERIFAPFFTTRAKGTGLGLAVVRRVAEAHAGRVTVEETPGGGATFVLRLPVRSPGTGRLSD